MKKFLTGFSSSETKKITSFLDRLFPYLEPKKFVIVGGMAIRYYLSIHHIAYPKRTFNDLDLMVKDLNVISPKIKNEFLIYHFHYQNPSNFFLPLVDPKTKIKIDIFDYSLKPVDPVLVDFNGQKIYLSSLEDQLSKTVFDLQRISEKSKVDPKQFLDAKLMLQIADLKKAEQIWKSRGYENYPASLIKAYEYAEKIAQAQPNYLKKNPFKRSRPYKCSKCKKDKTFPFTPMEKIYEILGYVE